MLTTVAKAAKHLWCCGDTRIATLASALSGYSWGICLLIPGDTLARPTYRYMNALAPEEVWAGIFLLIGTLQVYRLYSKLTKRAAFFDLVIKFIAMLLWTVVAVLCITAQWPVAAAMSDTFVIALATWWDFLRHDQSRRNSYYLEVKYWEDPDA